MHDSSFLPKANLDNILMAKSSSIPYSLILLASNSSDSLEDIASLFDQWLTSKSDVKIELKATQIFTDLWSILPSLIDLATMRDLSKKFNFDPQQIDLSCPLTITVDNQTTKILTSTSIHQFLQWFINAFAKVKLIHSELIDINPLRSTLNQVSEPTASDTIVFSSYRIIHHLNYYSWRASSLQLFAGLLGLTLQLEIKEVIGIEVKGSLPSALNEGDIIGATRQVLSEQQISYKVLEFFGPGLGSLSIRLRRLLINELREASLVFFPLDQVALSDAQLSPSLRRSAGWQSLIYEPKQRKTYSRTIELDLESLGPATKSKMVAKEEIIPINLSKKKRVSITFNWPNNDSYIAPSPLKAVICRERLHDISKARILAILGDNITTTQISATDDIKIDSLAGKYIYNLKQNHTLGHYEHRVGNWQAIARAMFTKCEDRKLDREFNYSGNTIYQIADRYNKKGIPMIIIAGKNYGIGLSNEWAAKILAIMGVKAVIAESFASSYRMDLISVGVIPLKFARGLRYKDLNLEGHEVIDIWGLEYKLAVGQKLVCSMVHKTGLVQQLDLFLDVTSVKEIEYLEATGIIPYKLKHS